MPGNALPAIPAIPLQPALPALPGAPGSRPMIPAPAAPQGNLQLEVPTLMVKNLASRLEQLQKSEACKNASPESKAELKKQIDELSKQIDGLRGQLGDK
jgi:hypothetical protein